jgi:hypothetical protein
MTTYLIVRIVHASYDSLFIFICHAYEGMFFCNLRSRVVISQGK